MTDLCVCVAMFVLYRSSDWLQGARRTSPEFNDSDSRLVWSPALRVKTESVLTLDGGSSERERGNLNSESVTMATWTRSLPPPQSFISSSIEFVDVVCYSMGNSMCSMA